MAILGLWCWQLSYTKIESMNMAFIIIHISHFSFYSVTPRTGLWRSFFKGNVPFFRYSLRPSTTAHTKLRQWKNICYASLHRRLWQTKELQMGVEKKFASIDFLEIVSKQLFFQKTTSNIHFLWIFDRMTAVRLDCHPEIALWKKLDKKNKSKV